eukprot:gene131-5495_t
MAAGTVAYMMDAGTVAYMSPECFNEKLGGVTTKADIFSFGIVLWELATQQRPWSGLNEFQMIYQVTVEQKRLTLPKQSENCPQQLIDLIARCWSDSPKDRPCSAEIRDQLVAMHTTAQQH